ncbi:cytochrome P450 2B4-like [Clavelina lepadiformis]|uniref:cytochrome P450 2B4-like n=1 Tax=Clavelina lepadiformis TaxID=159417 RepID=UPI004042EAA9
MEIDASLCNYLVAAFILLCFSFYHWYQRPKRFPPGPRGIPVLGVLPFLGRWIERKLYQWSREYGPVMAVRLGRKDMIVLSDYDVINQAFVKQGQKFSGRRHLSFYPPSHEKYGLVFLDYGPLFKSQRKFGVATLSGLGVGNSSMETRVKEETFYLNEAIRSKHGKTFDISKLLSKAIANNICSVTFGMRYDYDDTKFLEIIDTVLNEFHDPQVNTAFRSFSFEPKFRFIPPFRAGYQKFMSDLEFVKASLGQIIDEHDATFDGKNLRDFVDAFLKQIKAGKKEFTRKQLVGYMRDLLVAGTDTSSSTLLWAALCLLHFPDAQQKLYDEIKDIIGSEGSVSASHTTMMPYTNAFIQEVFRFRTLAPLGIIHKTNEDAELSGYVIPRNTAVIINIWAVHNDPDYWKDPGTFRPERFIDENGDFVKSNRVIPFSVGMRRCLGEQLARMEIFIFLVSLLQKFEFLPDEDESLPPLDYPSRASAFVPHPFKMIARER